MHRRTVRHSIAHRPLWFQALITLWGVWFTTALTEPAGLFACQMHSGMNNGHGVHATQGADQAVASSHAHHAATIVTHADPSVGTMDHATTAPAATPTVAWSLQIGNVATDLPTPHEHNCCSCLGQCCTASPAAAPVRAPEFAVESISDVVRAEFAECSHVPLQRAHALPYANGPPLTA